MKEAREKYDKPLIINKVAPRIPVFVLSIGEYWYF